MSTLAKFRMRPARGPALVIRMLHPDEKVNTATGIVISEGAERCLAHVGTEPSRSVPYGRTYLLDRHRDVMEAWSGYIGGAHA
ncbi:MAG: hypothetical protein OXU74_06705 [Gemmatimonadota bacterium]|nr:hypothetical protein [Gemmatimonadota bacterium]